jgi:molecular chaperone DnaJ
MQQGFFVVQKTCGTCQGAGQVISDPCRTCSGAGRVQKEKTLSVKIPAGVEDGNRIRLSGEGEAGVRGGPTGDLYIFVSVKPHELFKRNAENIFCQVPILMTDAVLGGEIIVPTVGGKKAKVKIPSGTQAGKQFRLKGKGMPIINSSRVGDMIIIAEIETPVNLSRAQKDMMKKFAAEKTNSWSPKSSKFFSKMKEFWGDLTD